MLWQAKKQNKASVCDAFEALHDPYSRDSLRKLQAAITPQVEITCQSLVREANA